MSVATHGQAAQHGFDDGHRQALEMAGQDEDVGCREQGGHVRAVAETTQARAEGRAREVRLHVLAVIRGEALAHHPEIGVQAGHGGQQLGVAFVADQAGDGDDHHAVSRRGEFGADPDAGGGIGMEDRRAAAVAHGLRVAGGCGGARRRRLPPARR